MLFIGESRTSGENIGSITSRCSGKRRTDMRERRKSSLGKY